MKFFSTLVISAITMSATANRLSYNEHVKGTTGVFGEVGYSHTNFKNSVEANGVYFSGGLKLTAKSHGLGFYFLPGITYQNEEVSGTIFHDMPSFLSRVNFVEEVRMERVFGGFKLGGTIDLNQVVTYRIGALLEKEIWTEVEVRTMVGDYEFEPENDDDYFSAGAELAVDFNLSRNFVLTPSLTWKRTFMNGKTDSDSALLGFAAVVQF